MKADQVISGEDCWRPEAFERLKQQLPDDPVVVQKIVCPGSLLKGDGLSLSESVLTEESTDDH
jgi:hypothetical protein